MDVNIKIWIIIALLKAIHLMEAKIYRPSSATNTTDSSRDEGMADDQEQMIDNPCMLSSYTRINISYQVDTINPAKMCQRLPENQWMTFIDTDNRAIEILQVTHSSTEYCIQPEYCGSRLPWYIHTDTQLRSNQVQYATLCTTDSTSRGTISCCESGKPILVAVCQDRIMYRMTKPIKRESCGTICTASKEDNHGTDTLAARLVGYDGFPAPQWYHRLTHQERANLVTVKFQIEYKQKPFYNEIKTQKALEQQIVKKWNLEHLLRRRRSSRYRATVKLQKQNIHHLKGTPVTKDHQSYFSFYIRDDKGGIIPSADLMDTLSGTILHTDVTSQGVCHVSEISQGKSVEIPDWPSHIELDTTTTSTISLSTQRAESGQSQNTASAGVSWITIVAIIGGTVAVGILLAVILLVYYKCCRSTKYIVRQREKMYKKCKAEPEVSRITLRWSKEIGEQEWSGETGRISSSELNNNHHSYGNAKNHGFSGD